VGPALEWQQHVNPRPGSGRAGLRFVDAEDAEDPQKAQKKSKTGLVFLQRLLRNFCVFCVQETSPHHPCQLPRGNATLTPCALRRVFAASKAPRGLHAGITSQAASLLACAQGFTHSCGRAAPSLTAVQHAIHSIPTGRVKTLPVVA